MLSATPTPVHARRLLTMLAMLICAINYATAILSVRRYPRSYEVIFVVLGIGFISGFFAFAYFFIGLYAIFVNIVWIFYLRRNEVKIYFHLKIWAKSGIANRYQMTGVHSVKIATIFLARTTLNKNYA